VSIVTLNKFLLSSRSQAEASVPDAPSGDYLDVASRAIAAIRRSVLGGETFTDLFEEMDSVRKNLHIGGTREATTQCAVRIEEILSTYQSRLRQEEIDRSADFKNILDILNQVLGHLTVDDQESQTGRRQLESDLVLAARIDDISTLRKHLAKVLHSVREEGRQSKDKTQEVIKSLGQQIQQVHKAQSRFTTSLPGRNSAIEYLTPMLDTNNPPPNLHVAMFTSDSFRMIRERHGEEAANFILQDLGRKQLQPLFPDAEMFCWSPNVLSVIWQHHEESTSPADISARVKSPYEQKVFVGTRMAVFNITLRSLVMPARGTLKELMWALDRFSRGGPQ
jgi:GGDEF domain-containing protein